MPEINNHWLKTQIQNRLETLNYQKKLKFKNLRCCGSVLMQSSGAAGVIVESNGIDSRFTGLSHCGNAWLCAECSAKVMAKQAKWVSSALDYASSQGLVAFMATFTIGHNYFLTASEVINALYDAWSLCWNNKLNRGNPAFRNFKKECQIKHFIKVCEINYSVKRGWHPHFHILFFLPEELMQKPLEFEEAMQQRWQDVCKFYLKKEIAKRTKHKLKESYIDSIYENKSETSKGIYFSKDKDGKIFAQDSADYICGWDVTAEITGSEFKSDTKSEYSMTIYQLMEAAIMNDSKEAWQKYLELAEAVFKKRARIAWSHTGLKKAATANMEHYEEVVKKKNTGAEKKQPFKVVCFIPSKLWLNICAIDYDHVIENLILEFAIFDNGFSLISELLATFNLPAPLQIYKTAEQKIEAAA